MKTRTKWIVGAVIVVAVGAGAWIFLGGSGTPVDVSTVVRDSLSVTVTEEGRTRARTRYVVAAPITGRVSRTELEEGTSVEEGQVLVTIAPPPEDPRAAAVARAEVRAAEARLAETRVAVEEARSTYEQTTREVERRRPLLELGSISEESFERYVEEAEAARNRLERARATVRSAEAALEAARARLLGVDEGPTGAARPIRAPVSGTVLRVVEENERVVQAGTPLFEISGAEGYELIVDVLTEAAVEIDPGDPIRITGWGGDETLEGAVRYVEPAAFTEISALGVEEQRVNVVGDLFDPPKGLGSGFRVDAAIVTWSGEDVLTVPASAVFQQRGGWRAFAVVDGRARLREVEVGRRGSDRVQILSGLEEGERVILFPSDVVGDGVRVEPQQEAGGNGTAAAGAESTGRGRSSLTLTPVRPVAPRWGRRYLFDRRVFRLIPSNFRSPEPSSDGVVETALRQRL